MAFLTYAAASRLGKELTEARFEKSASAATAPKDVFVAHATLDSQHLRGIARILVGHFASYYIDKLDSLLPLLTSTKTAEMLADRIATSRRLVVVVAKHSAQSRWVPWELGLAHGILGAKCAATLPIATLSEEQPWARQEYLGLYPQITWHEGKQRWIVTDPADGRYWSLASWIRADTLD
jgi:hypothetical protein